MLRVSILLALVACGGGGGGNNPGDGPPGGGDGPPGDGPMPDAPPTTIKLVFLSQGQKIPGVPVLFQAPDDSVLAMVTTDSDGVAQAMVPAHTNVSALPTFSDGSFGALVVLDAKPGDTIEIGGPLVPEQSAVFGDITVKLPPPSGQPQFFLIQRCRTDNTTQQMITFRPCGTPTNFLVSDNNKGTFYTDEIALTEGQTVDLSAQTFHGTRTMVLRAVNAPQPQFTFGSETTFTVDRGLTISNLQTGNIAVPGGTGQVVHTIADIPNFPVTSEIDIATDHGTMHMVHRKPPEDMVVLNFALGGVPFVTGKTFDGTVFSWTEQGSGGDYVYAFIRNENPAGTARRIVNIAGPKTGTTLRVPIYPAPFEDHNFKAGDSPFIQRAGVAKVTGGWDAARQFVHRDDFLNNHGWMTGDLAEAE